MYRSGWTSSPDTAMSSLLPGDRHMHYSDGSHRWIAPPNMDQLSWEAHVRVHKEQHLKTMGGPLDPSRSRVEAAEYEAWAAGQARSA